jgi:2-dehydro-3-deoxyphosphogluconate aldolase/(4S)-4-hydroxy-2-oxoglutarate aldolase
MSTAIQQVLEKKIIPVVAIHDAAHSNALTEALLFGGLPCVEITFRTAAAPDAVEAMAQRGDMMVGAGTVLSVEQVKQAMDAGAVFIVAPGLNPKVVTYCLAQNIPVTPCVATPTDIETALDLGLSVLKHFPAEAFGGLKTLKAISALYSDVKFIPTGGINAGNVVNYSEHPKVVACGGSWMVKSAYIADGQFDRISDLTLEAVTPVKDL